MNRTLTRAAGIIILPGLALALLPGLGLRTTDCGPIDCALLQAIGKIAVCVAFFLVTAAFALRGIAARSATTVAIALILMIPSVVFPGIVVQTYRDFATGGGELNQMVAAARAYAAEASAKPVEEFTGLAIDGKPGWAAVRVTDSAARSQIVVLRGANGVWTARAIAPRFDREALRGLGAPSDLIREQD